MHPLHQVHPSLLPQPMLHHEGTLIKRGPFWVGNKKYREGLSLCDFFLFPSFIIKKNSSHICFLCLPISNSSMRSQSIEMEGFPVFIKAVIQPLNPHETQNNGQVSSLTGLFLSTTFIVSKTCAFNLILVFLSSQWSVGGRQKTQHTISQWFMPLGVGSLFWLYMDCGMALFSPTSSFCSLKVWYHVSSFCLVDCWVNC